MKKIWTMGLLVLLFIQACKKDQKLIDNEKPEERVSKELEKYKDELINAPNGWVAHLYTSTIKGDYSFYMNFRSDNVLSIRADFDEKSLKTEQISTYRLKKAMATTLIFDTDNYLHVLIDPSTQSGGKEGLGFGSDTEFEIREQTGDTLKLVGKRRHTILTLIKATTADKDFFVNDGSKDLRDYIKANPYLYIPDEKDLAKKIQISINSDITNRKISFSAANNNVLTSAEQLFSFSFPGISNAPLTYGGRTFIGFEWDNVNEKLFAITLKGERIEVLVSATPSRPLHLLIGTDYSSITVPNQTTYPGWGNDFISRRANAAKLPYALRLEAMNFAFNTDAKKVVLTVTIPQGTTTYLAIFGYNFTKTNTGIFKFSKDQSPQGQNSNAGLIESAMAPLLAERLEADTFTLDYFVHPVTKAILAQFKSVEHPDFTFTGTL